MQIRSKLGLAEMLFFPVMVFLERIMPVVFEGFHYEIVPVGEFPSCKHADTDIVNRCIRIREDIYYRAVDGHGRDRMTVAHEIAHYFLFVICGVRFDRSFGNTPIEAFRDPEWQADALAGELLCPHHLIEGLSTEQIMTQCMVSELAAEFSLSLCKE
jgi:Zn-dependent peptidase ImmA (M78 family)